MSAASAILERGFRALAAHHGEALTWHPASVVVKREAGEALWGNPGKPIISDESEAVTFTGIFNESWAQISPVDGSIISTAPAVMFESSELPEADRGDVVIRSGVYYSVIEARPHGVGSSVAILSKHVH